MIGRTRVAKHGRDHRPGGHDPIPGLGGLPYAIVGRLAANFSIQGAPILADTSFDFPLDPAGQFFGNLDGFVAHPPLVIPAGGYAGWMGGCQFSNIDTTSDDFKTKIRMSSFNAALTEMMTVEAEIDLVGGVSNDANSYVGSSMSVVASTGSDLSYDTTTGKIFTTAGGAFAMTASWHGAWA